MPSSFINHQYPPSVPGTSSGATMTSFSGGSPSTNQLGGHGYTSPLADFILGDIPTTNPASHLQYQWPPLFASPSTSNHVANSHAPQVTGPLHIRLMYSSSMATFEEQQIVPPAMAIPPIRPPSPPQNENPFPPHKPAGRCRKRIHSCSMCEKAFDRPSTLKKHMLVHTGEKSHVCDICSRRFSVASNLNRHVRRCVLRPVNIMHNGHSNSGQSVDVDSASATSHTARSGSDGCSTGTLSETTLSPRSSASSPKRTSTSYPNHEGGALRPAKKRPRRAPTPTPWIPLSLRGFDLTPSRKSCPVPLAPVRPSPWDGEERDSFGMDELPQNPYHPEGWVGKLPGPAYRPIHTGMMVQRIELY
ncbi:hypothetical protein B0F90DRAFT_1812918 [Multifurca ochricompacta]|uniref:C2H2-type domain-containing protein n=1 Tax=Multifurca ochricompacta TaxID=376703 RepID=A0AAD4MEF8_9AGAM|nr:hypothetical protein B0F90DRAFT_1812918 [Multifurca ochricompacta]